MTNLSTSELITLNKCFQFGAFSEGHYPSIHSLYSNKMPFSKTVLNRTSDCARGITVDALSGTAAVFFNNGRVYEYKNVSRRSIINFMLNECASLGFFVNNILKDSRVVATQI